MIGETESRSGIAIDVPRGFVVFCGMDGTLLDNDHASYSSYKQAILEVTHGMHDVQRSAERLNRESLKKQLPSLSDAECKKIANLKAEYFTKFLSETRVNVSLASLIRWFSGKNEIVLVTGGRKKRVLETLRHHKMRELFSQLICREDLRLGSSNKYEDALRLMGANPESVIIFENDIVDAEKAVLAGVPRRNVLRVFSTD